MRAQCRRSRRRRCAPPKLLDQPIARNDFVCVQDEEREERALLSAPHWDRSATVHDLERPENTELHRAIVREQPRSFNRSATPRCERRPDLRRLERSDVITSTDLRLVRRGAVSLAVAGLIAAPI